MRCLISVKNVADNVCYVVLGFLMSSLVMAGTVGPAVVATADRDLWVEAINSQSGFDKASRAMQLIYVRNLHSMKFMTNDEMLSSFKIKSVNRASVDKWIKNELNLTLNNYQKAAINCDSSDWSCLVTVNSVDDLLVQANAVVSQLSENYSAWRENLDGFTQVYIAEQMRLAALFPKVSSEIDTFNTTEWTGADLTDRTFYLSFDDGPTKLGGLTDETLKMLRENNKSAVFFVLGNKLQTRIKSSGVAESKKLYASQCLALHGWEHKSHAKWAEWKDSIINTNNLTMDIAEGNNLLPLFRPPYGQRKDDSGDFFQAQHLKVALWNIDSQDWNKGIDSNAVVNRIVTLMLIKRHGVILFHDIHPKANIALPVIFEQFGNAVVWGECQALTTL